METYILSITLVILLVIALTDETRFVIFGFISGFLFANAYIHVLDKLR